MIKIFDFPTLLMAFRKRQEQIFMFGKSKSSTKTGECIFQGILGSIGN